MRKVALSAMGAGLIVALIGAIAPAGHAEENAEAPPIETSADADLSAGRTTGVTIGSARNQATGDVLGLGYEQVIRIEGTAVVIAEPTYRGGARLQRFDAKLSQAWPNSLSYYGQKNLEDVVRHAPSRIAVLGTDIYVSRLFEFKADGQSRWDSVVSKYRADGTFQTSREFQNHAITALDAYRLDGREYLAIGLNRHGVRVAYADRPNLPDFRAVHEDWTGWERGDYNQDFERDQATVVKLGVDHTGRLMLIAGKITYAHPAVVATDLRVGVDGVWAGEHMWTNNLRSKTDYNRHWLFPDLVDFGSLDPSGRPVVAIAWPRIGRVSFLDAATGADWTWIDRGAGAHAIRFFTDRDGNGLIAIARDSHNGSESYVIGTASSRGEFVVLREGRKDDLPEVLAELTAP